MKIDIFPALNLPVIYVAQPYGGMDPAQMEGLITNYYEYHFLYITGIHHVESKNIQGVALMKLYFHPGTDMAQAMAETVGYVNRLAGLHAARHRRRRSSCASTPAACRSATWCCPARPRPSARSRTRPCSRSGRCSPACPASRRRRPSAATSGPSSSASTPTGCAAYNVSPEDVVAALDGGNTISPSGNVRIKDQMPIVPVNAMVVRPAGAGQHPASGPAQTSISATVGARIEDSTDIPTGYALVNGKRAVYILVTKRADASTLGGGQRGQGEPAADAGGAARGHRASASSSTSRPTSPAPCGASASKGCSARS